MVRANHTARWSLRSFGIRMFTLNLNFSWCNDAGKFKCSSHNLQAKKSVTLFGLNFNCDLQPHLGQLDHRTDHPLTVRTLQSLWRSVRSKVLQVRRRFIITEHSSKCQRLISWKIFQNSKIKISCPTESDWRLNRPGLCAASRNAWANSKLRLTQAERNPELKFWMPSQNVCACGLSN